MALYLLPCPTCGAPITVDDAEAGRETQCHQGHDVVIPSWRELQKLERATTAPTQTAPTWTNKRKYIFIGAIIFSIGASLAINQYRQYPSAPPLEEIIEFNRQGIESAKPGHLLEYWKEGILETGIDAPKNPYEIAVEAEQAQSRTNIAICLAIAAIGLIIQIIAALWPQAPNHPPRPETR